MGQWMIFYFHVGVSNRVNVQRVHIFCRTNMWCKSKALPFLLALGNDMLSQSLQDFWEMWPYSYSATVNGRNHHNNHIRGLSTHIRRLSFEWSYGESCILSVVISIKVLLKFQHTEFHLFQESIRHNLWKQAFKSVFYSWISKCVGARKCKASHRVCINKERRAFWARCQHLRRPQKLWSQPSHAIAKVTHSITGQWVKVGLNRLPCKQKSGRDRG